MEYTIKGQESLSLLDSKFRACDQEHAVYQFEIYTTSKKQKIGILNNFNDNKFTHPIDSRVKFTPKLSVNGVLLSPSYTTRKFIDKNQEKQK